MALSKSVKECYSCQSPMRREPKSAWSQFPQPGLFSKARGRKVEQNGSKLLGRGKRHQLPSEWGRPGVRRVRRVRGQGAFSFTYH